jgi:transposase-like protein
MHKQDLTKKKMKKKIKVYNCDFKEKAVQLSYQASNLTKLEEQLGIYQGALHKWRKAYEKSGKESFHKKVPSELHLKELKIYELQKKIEKSDLAFALIKSAGKALYDGKPMIFEFMSANEKNYSIACMSKILGVHRTTYLKWKKQYITEEQKIKILIKEEISILFYASQQCYGKQRIRAALQNLGYQISNATVGRYMRELGIYVSCKKNPN